MHLDQNNKACENLLLYIFLSMILFLLFDVNFFFVYARQILMFLPFSDLSGLERKNVLFIEIYIYTMKSSILPLTKYAIFM